jgi:uncharacterized integral membrane protein
VADEITPQKKRDTGRIVRLGIAGVLVLALAGFVLDNTDSVQVGFVFTDKELSLIWVILIALVLGIVLDRLWQFIRRRA